MLSMENDLSNTSARAHRRLIYSLYTQKKYKDAEVICTEWLNSNFSPQPTTDMGKLLERYRTVIQLANGQTNNPKISQQKLDEEMEIIDGKLEKWVIKNLTNDRISKILNGSSTSVVIAGEINSSSISLSSSSTSLSSNNTNSASGSSALITSFQKQIDQIGSIKLDEDDSNIVCSYCAITFNDRAELRQHCQTESHQNVIMSDEGRDWKYRPPPRGYAADSYSQCENFVETAVCHYGNQCVEAHGLEELNEWKERFEYRKMKLQRACEKELYGKSYTEQLLEKWIQAPSPDKIMKEKLDSIEETCPNDLITTVSSKVSKREWTFVLKTKRLLRAVALLQDTHRNHFTIKQVFPAEPRPPAKRGQNGGNKVVEAELTSDQEWVVSNQDIRYTEVPTDTSPILEHRVKVVFSTDIYGTFRQSVVFDFGNEPVLVKHLCVDVIPVADADKIQEIKKEIVLSSSERWNEENCSLVPFTTAMLQHLQTPSHASDVERERELLERYPCPKAATFTLTQSTIMEKRLTKNNYRNRIHELLYVEEIARYEQVARYNLSTKLSIVTNYLLTPSGMATSTAKYSHSGELFALMTLGKDVSEDTSAGRLILNNCTTVYMSAPDSPAPKNGEKRPVYEALIEDKGKNMIYLKLSAPSVTGLGMIADSEFKCDIQFQLNRLSYCEWHHAVDKIADFRLIFPETFSYSHNTIPWTPKKQWSDTLDVKLNLKQKEAVMAITTPTNIALPPILLIGPFGTGKTYTLAQAIKQLLRQPEAKILICTHSNSAADLYIKDYLHPWVEDGMDEAKPLRVYYHKRWVATVNTIVQKYCLIETNGNVRNFRRPGIEDILKHRIVVVTLSISMELASLDLPKGHFTHILLDEAAQAMECEAIMPLALAGETTRIVLAGDHMQMSPELFSNFAKERKLHISLLERLYDHYPTDFPCKILLCENYRAHEAIIKFTSELFYDQKLIASGKQPKHDKFYPLTFFTTRGEDVQDKNSTAFYNNSEVYEVVERVCELRKKWPTSWGKINDQSIGIMTPYADQVFRIRSELRKRRMGGISVERVLNVQGKQFRAIFLSTVRTRRTCTPNSGTAQSDDMDYGFLSNSKLLNTAITRAQSLVAVVGDPVALCSIGRCRKVWERFIEICNLNKSLFGITWSLLRSQLDGVELKKMYVLNPLAKEFIPRALQAEAYIKDQQASFVGQFNHQQQQQQHQQQPHPQPHQSNQSQNQMSGGYAGGINNPVIYQNSQSLQQMRPPNLMNSSSNHHQMQQPPPFNNQQSQSQQQNYPQHPFYYYQQQQQQQQPQLRPLAPLCGPGNQFPPQVPPPGGNSATNLWGSFPVPPPPPNLQGLSSQQQQSMGRPPPQLNLNIPNRPQIPPPRSPGSLNQQHPIFYGPNQKLQQPQPFIIPPNQQQTLQQPINHLRNLSGGGGVAGPMSPAFQQHASDQHISPLTNDIMASITARATQMQHHNPVSSGVTNQKSGHPSIEVRHVQDKDNIQFLQNVHFPEQRSGVNNHHSSDFSHLLPAGVSFYDMAMEPKEIQFKWYVNLVETLGLDSANKFTEILRQIPINNLGSVAAQQLGGVAKIGNNNRDQVISTIPTTGDSSQVDLVFDSIMNGTPINQLGLRDILGVTNQNQQHAQTQQSMMINTAMPPQYINNNLMAMAAANQQRNASSISVAPAVLQQQLHQQQQLQQQQQQQQQQQLQHVPSNTPQQVVSSSSHNHHSYGQHHNVYYDLNTQQTSNGSCAITPSIYSDISPGSMMTPSIMQIEQQIHQHQQSHHQHNHISSSRKRKTSYTESCDLGDDDLEDDSKQMRTNDESKKQNHSEIEKRRRDKMNTYITELSAMVPMCHAMSRKLDKLTVLRMAVQHLKTIRGAVHSYTEGHYKPAFLSDQELKMLILQAAEGFLFVVGCDRGRILYVSESVSQILNYSQGELLGQSWFDILHPKDVAKVKEQLSSSDLSPRDRLIDAKTMLPVKTDIPLGASRMIPGARRSFFCRMKCKISTQVKEETDSASTSATISGGACHRRKKQISSDKKYSVIQCTGYLKSWAPAKIGLEEQEGDGDGDNCNLSCLVAVGRIPPNIFASNLSTPVNNNPILRSIQFISRHAMDGKFLFVDQRATLVLGFLPQELLGTSMYEYYHHEDIPSLAESHKAALQNSEKVVTQFYRFRTKDNGFIQLQSEWKSFKNPWTKDVEYLIAKNSVILNDYRTMESNIYRPDGSTNLSGNFDFLNNSNNREMQRMINTHVEASKIGRQIAEQVLDYQRRVGDTSSDSSPDPDLGDSTLSHQLTPTGPNSVSSDLGGSIRRLPQLTVAVTRVNGTLPGYNHVRNNSTINLDHATDSELMNMISGPPSISESNNPATANDGNDEAAMSVIMSLLEADAGLGGPVDFTGLPWPLP